MQFETYATGSTSANGGGAALVAAGFSIQVRFLSGLKESHKKAFKTAADRWAAVITGKLPAVRVDGEVIENVLILAQAREIDGVGGILGQAGPTFLRPANAGKAAFIPAKGIMSFDTSDLKKMEEEDTLVDVITHEMGHVIGMGTIWRDKKFLKGAGTENPTFTGPLAMKEYAALVGGNARPVPVENTGGPGTRDSHWRDSVFRHELMTGFVGSSGNPISRLTVACLADLGYEVNMSKAEPYALPNLVELAASGALVAEKGAFRDGDVMGSIPVVLPPEALVE